jgi:hypothetical protein
MVPLISEENHSNLTLYVVFCAVVRMDAFCFHCVSFSTIHFSLVEQLKLGETYEPLLPWFRESEIRHGRTAMLAVVGFITTDFVRIPGDLYSFEAIPKTIDAHDALLRSGPMLQLLLFIGLFDFVITAPACVATMKGEREPGGK